jgi:hypothetical protein
MYSFSPSLRSLSGFRAPLSQRLPADYQSRERIHNNWEYPEQCQVHSAGQSDTFASTKAVLIWQMYIWTWTPESNVSAWTNSNTRAGNRANTDRVRDDLRPQRSNFKGDCQSPIGVGWMTRRVKPTIYWMLFCWRRPSSTVPLNSFRSAAWQNSHSKELEAVRRWFCDYGPISFFHIFSLCDWKPKSTSRL